MHPHVALRLGELIMKFAPPLGIGGAIIGGAFIGLQTDCSVGGLSSVGNYECTDPFGSFSAPYSDTIEVSLGHVALGAVIGLGVGLLITAVVLLVQASQPKDDSQQD
jgi:hypothetical protein